MLTKCYYFYNFCFGTIVDGCRELFSTIVQMRLAITNGIFFSSVLDDLWKTSLCISRRVGGGKLAKSQLSQLVLKCRSFDLFQGNFGNLNKFTNDHNLTSVFLC